MGLRTKKVRFDLEALDNRLTPAVDAFIGVQTVSPPSDHAPAHTVDIHHQPAHGLKTAEAHNPVIEWTPT